MNIVLPDTTRLNDLHAKLRQQWERHLESGGVIFPAGMPLADLLALFAALGCPVHKDCVADWTHHAWKIGWLTSGEPGGDRQCRHLRADGWHVLGSGGKAQLEDRTMSDGKPVPAGCYVLASVTTAAPSFLRASRMKRLGRLGARDWLDLCLYYDNRCAICRRDGKLERGHMDPDKPPSLDNIVPLCAACNNRAGDDWVLGPDGWPKFCRKPELLRTSSVEILLQ